MPTAVSCNTVENADGGDQSFLGLTGNDSSHDCLVQIGRCYHHSLFEIGVSVALFGEPHTSDIVSAMN